MLIEPPKIVKNTKERQCFLSESVKYNIKTKIIDSA